MRYQEYKPPNELASFIKLFWVFEGHSPEPTPEKIVADGYPELIIHFRSPFLKTDNSGGFASQPTAVVCGQLTNPLLLYSSLDAGMVGIRFQPSGMAPFLSTSMSSLTDEQVPAENLFVDVDQLVEEVSESRNDDERIAACNRFLMRSLDFRSTDKSIRRALAGITRSRGQISVESMAALTGKSRRSLELAFQKEVGVSPKMYCRITRFRHLFDLVSEGPSESWVKLALDSGFFDQSHLIRDFRRFCGEAPTSFLFEKPSFAHSVNQA